MKKLILLFLILCPFLLIAQPKIGKFDRLYAPYIFGGVKDTSKFVFIPTRATPSATTNIAFDWRYGAGGVNSGMVMTQAGRVGIMKTNPAQALDVNGHILAVYQGAFISTQTTDNNYGTYIALGSTTGASASNPSWQFTRVATSNHFSFQQYDGSTLYDRLSIGKSGNVGIGTTSPTAKLHVASGTVKIGETADSVVMSTTAPIKLYGNSTVWDDLIFSFSTGVNAGASYPAYNADSMYWNFVVDTTSASICKKYYTVQIPHRAQEGNITILPHVHYRHTTTNGTPTFIIKYRWYNIGEKPGAFTWKRFTNVTGTTDGTHQINYPTTGITKSNSTLSSLLDVQVYLYSQSGTGGINAMQFDLHIPIDKLGSASETSN